MRLNTRMTCALLAGINKAIEQDSNRSKSCAAQLLSSRSFRALRHADTVLTPEVSTAHLGPLSRNIHSFEALASTAVLDLLTPPYNAAECRDCHYFEAVESNGSVDQLEPHEGPRPRQCTLRLIAEPSYLIIRHAEYCGLSIDALLQAAAHGHAPSVSSSRCSIA